jgi:hypothetical protein
LQHKYFYKKRGDKKMKTFTKFSGFLGLIAMLGFSPLAIADDEFSDDWKIAVTGAATTDGDISFKLVYAPSDEGLAGDEKFINVSVASGSSNRDAANSIAKAFNLILHQSVVHVKVDDGSTVEVRSKGQTPDFNLTVASNKVEGISLDLSD